METDLLKRTLAFRGLSDEDTEEEADDADVDLDEDDDDDLDEESEPGVITEPDKDDGLVTEE